MKKLQILLFVMVIGCPQLSIGQTKIEGHWGKPYLNVAYSCAATHDSGYVLTGLTKDGINNDEGDIIVVKLNSAGDTQWTFLLCASLLQGGNCVIQAADGGYMVSGHTENYGSVDCDAYFLKLDSLGNYKWLTHWGGYADDIAEGTIQLPDGGYICTGITASFGNPDTSIQNRHIYFVRVDSTGDTLWTKWYAGANEEYGYSIAMIPSGGFFADGWSSSWGAGEKDGWLFRLDNNGNLLWKKLFKSDTGDTKLFKIIPTSDGGYILAGGTSQPLNSSSSLIYNHSQGLAIKVDSGGNVLWQKTYGLVTDGIQLHDVAQLPNGDFMFTGYSFVEDSTGNAYVLTTDASGNKISDNYTGGVYSYACGIALQGNNSYLIAGTTALYGNTYGDLYWMEMQNADAAAPNIKKLSAKLYPNPVNGISEIVLPAPYANQHVTFEITTTEGRVVKRIENVAAKDLIINKKEMTTGIFIYKITGADETIFAGKFQIE